jgi:DinB superfamily
MNNEFLTQQCTKLSDFSKRAVDKFGALTPDQLNWKPLPTSWSIAQCLDHLMVSNSLYFNDFEAIAKGTHKRPFWSYIPGMTNMTGNFLLKSVLPGSTKIKTPKVFEPVQSNLPADVVQQFISNQQAIILHLKSLQNADETHTILASPALGLFTYTLKKCMEILTAHEVRHLLQAERVLSAMQQQ